ncbi:hypothetical protein PVAP13_9NG071873 [Panicum virgatum]|uniref:Uncharacterized protein n=1 Tax=Panicum virgatum TaxID=38727 RepID=A0A8T0MDH5_PANVG|nr:hypothetical protein PVAP13_9NG071873 [Panicum virgatum]
MRPPRASPRRIRLSAAPKPPLRPRNPPRRHPNPPLQHPIRPTTALIRRGGTCHRAFPPLQKLGPASIRRRLLAPPGEPSPVVASPYSVGLDPRGRRPSCSVACPFLCSLAPAPLSIRPPCALQPPPPRRPRWSLHRPPSSSGRPGSTLWQHGCTPVCSTPPPLPLPFAPPPASPAIRPPRPLAACHPPAMPLFQGRPMAGGGEDPFRTYSQPDPRFASGYYPLFPSSWTQPGAAGGSQPQPHGFSGAMNAPSHAFSGYDQNALFFASSASATAAAGGMAGPAHGYSGYGLTSGFFELAPHAGYAPLQNPQGIRHPPRHHGKEVMTRAVVGMPLLTWHRPPPHPWYAPPMGDDPASSAVPGHPRTRSQSRRQAVSPVADRSTNDDSMASDGGDDDLSLASSSGDNAGFIGNAAGVQEDEGDVDSSGSEADDSSSEGESSWGSEGNSSSEVYEELYKDWEELFGKENPVFKGMKIVMESTRMTTKLMKKAIVLARQLHAAADSRPASSSTPYGCSVLPPAVTRNALRSSTAMRVQATSTTMATGWCWWRTWCASRTPRSRGCIAHSTIRPHSTCLPLLLASGSPPPELAH